MARWRQCQQTHKLIPIGEWNQDVNGRGGSATIFGDIESFVSPIDGTVISDRKQLREHNKRNNVVSADEFTPEYYAAAAKKRQDFYERNRTPDQVRKDRMEIYETLVRHERQQS